MVGASDRETLRACLRAVCAKYSHEQAGFDRAFDALFRPAAGKAHAERMASRAEVADGLPTALGIDEDQEVGRYAEYNERSEEHTSELQSLMRISYAVLCWKKK